MTHQLQLAQHSPHELVQNILRLNNQKSVKKMVERKMAQRKIVQNKMVQKGIVRNLIHEGNTCMMYGMMQSMTYSESFCYLDNTFPLPHGHSNHRKMLKMFLIQTMRGR